MSPLSSPGSCLRHVLKVLLQTTKRLLADLYHLQLRDIKYLLRRQEQKRRFHVPTVFILLFSFIDRLITITTGSCFRTAHDSDKNVLAAIFGSRGKLFLNRISEWQKPVCPGTLYWRICHANRPDFISWHERFGIQARSS